MKVCLTFDNGPEPLATPVVLEVLAKRGLKATFFVIGEKLRDPARFQLAQRAKNEGHTIANHTLTHSVPLGLRSPSEALYEIIETEKLLQDLNTEKIFRPNAGGGILGPHMLSRTALSHLQANGYTVITWNAVPKDWEAVDDNTWAERALEMCRKEQGTTVLVLHDLRPKAVADLDAFLGQLIEEKAEFTQEFPRSVVPVEKGRLMWSSTESFVTEDRGAEKL